MEARRAGASPVVAALVGVWVVAKLLQESVPQLFPGWVSARSPHGLVGISLEEETMNSTTTLTSTLPPKPWYEQLSGSSPPIVEAGWPSEPVQAVCLEKLWGGFGNQLEMLRVAVETARQLGLQFVRLPRTRNPDPRFQTMWAVLDLEDVWQLGTEVHSVQEAPQNVSCIATCTEWPYCTHLNGNHFSIGLRRTPEIWRKLISEKGRLRCNELRSFRARGPETLTMHMRSGDVLNDIKRGGLEYWKMPPCGFWLKAFQQGSYSFALIVTEADRAHPCIEVVNRSLPGRVTVQSSNPLEDFCTMMHSRDIAVAISTLGLVVLELSLVTRVVYTPSYWADKAFAMSRSFEKCFAADFPGYPWQFRDVAHKMEFLRSYPREKIVFKEKTCGPEHHRPIFR